MGERNPALPAYIAYHRVRFSELDPIGHVNNAAYVNILEQAAIDHAEALDMSQERQAMFGGVFIVRRHLIDYLRPAIRRDLLRIVTWIEEMQGARATRCYEIERRPAGADDEWLQPDRVLAPGEELPGFGDVILRARTDWAFVDVTSGRPRRMPSEVIAIGLAHPR